MVNNNLSTILKQLYSNDLNIDSIYINNITMQILSISNPTIDDIDNADSIIKISNILYNNTTKEVLPLEDGIYDLLMVWIKRYKPDYQIGAPELTLSSEASTVSDDSVMTIPLIKLDSTTIKPGQMIFTKDILPNRIPSANMYSSYPIYNLSPLKRQNVTTTHKYPSLVGTLDKCKFVLNSQAIEKGVFDDPNVQVFERDFIQKNIEAGILDPNRKFYMTLELKYDGVSVEAEVTDHVIMALSRGDTNNNLATDLTPVLGGYVFPKAVDKVNTSNGSFGMKFEAMISNLDLARISIDKDKAYKNPRNTIIGLLASSDANRWRDYITLVPLATSLGIDRLIELDFMNEYYDNGELLRYALVEGTYLEILFQVKRFVDEAEYLRPIMPYTYDGVVCSFIEHDIITALGRENSVNKYQMAIKFNPQKKQTVFIGYTYSVAQNGTITPIAHYNPVELFGCTHSKTTVHSYKRFMELSLKVGDIVSIELVNDVIPYISSMDIKDNDNNPNTIIEFPVICPVCGAELELSKTGKTAYCPNHKCPGRAMGIMVNMLDKIGFKDFSEESLKLIDKIHNLSDLLNITRNDVLCLGDKEADNFMIRVEELKTVPLYDYRAVGALGFTDVAAEKWKLILNKLPLGYIVSNPSNLRESLLSIKGIGPSSADTIVGELDVFLEDLIAIYNMPNIKPSYGESKGKKIRFTGCRDQELIDTLSSLGHDISGGNATKDTDILIIPTVGFTSTKTQLVGSNCKLIDISTFRENLDTILL